MRSSSGYLGIVNHIKLSDYCLSLAVIFNINVNGMICRALREVWPHSLEKVNLVEPSQSMQRAGQSLIQGS